MTSTILGIETSCDETAVAIVTGDKRILVNLVHSQTEHEATGGVVPEIAARAHLNYIDDMVTRAMQEAKLDFKDLSGVAVTAGPGLIGGVFVGVMTAKAIAIVHDLPLIGVNHLEGHALTVRLTDDVAFPYLLLLVSGGHCQLLIVRGVGKYTRLGSTLDDAAGEAFDKTAKMLGLGYPGGPALEKKAAECTDIKAAVKKYALPKPLFGKPGCDFSFSGLKTAVRRAIEKFGTDDTVGLCAAFQETVAAVLADRTRRAIAEYMKLSPADPALVVAGGVAANKRLCGELTKLAKDNDMRFIAPPLALCTDNAAMIAWAGAERLALGMTDSMDFPVHARWPLDPDAAVKYKKG